MLLAIPRQLHGEPQPPPSPPHVPPRPTISRTPQSMLIPEVPNATSHLN
jgi:hypothetical protein